MASFVSATDPNYKLFLVVLGGIGAIALTSALAGCITARCFESCQCKRKRVQVDIETALPSAPSSTVDSSDSTITQNELGVHDSITQRMEKLLDTKIYVGTEAEQFAKRISKPSGYTVELPILSTELSSVPRRSLSDEKGSDSQGVNAVGAIVAQRKENVMEADRVE